MSAYRTDTTVADELRGKENQKILCGERHFTGALQVDYWVKEKNGGAKTPRRSLRGLWADLNIHITEEDIAQARREMWGNFPRDIY